MMLHSLNPSPNQQQFIGLYKIFSKTSSRHVLGGPHHWNAFWDDHSHSWCPPSLMNYRNKWHRAEESQSHINTTERELCSNVKLPNKWDWKTLWGVFSTSPLSSIRNIAMQVHAGLGQTATLSISPGGIKVYLWSPQAGVKEDWQTWKSSSLPGAI